MSSYGKGGLDPAAGLNDLWREAQALRQELDQARKVIRLQAMSIRILTGEHDPRPMSSLQQDPELTGRWNLSQLAAEAAQLAARKEGL